MLAGTNGERLSINSIQNINKFMEPETMGEVNSIDAIAGKISLDPESLKLLEKKATSSNVNFEKVLNSVKKGQDPEAIIELLKSQQNGIDKSELPQIKEAFRKEEQQDLTGLPKMVNKKIGTEGINNITPINVENEELKFVLRDKSVPNDFIQEQASSVDSNIKSAQKLEHTDLLPRKESEVFFGKTSMKKEISDMSNKNVTPEALSINKEVIRDETPHILDQFQRIPQLKKTGIPVKSEGVVDLNQFIANQSPASQKMMQQQLIKNAYRPVSQSIFDKKISESLPAVNVKRVDNGELTSLKDIIFSGNKSEPSNELKIAHEVIGITDIDSDLSKNKNTIVEPTKVFKLSSVQSLTTPDELINKVQDYIIQSRVGNKAEVKMAFHHDELGQVDLIVKKIDSSMNVAINPHTVHGKDFFKSHQVELVRHLSQAGVPVGDFKIELPLLNVNQGSFSQSLSQNDSSSSKQGNHDFSSFNHQRGNHQSESGQREHDSRRREELWEKYYEKEVA